MHKELTVQLAISECDRLNCCNFFLKPSTAYLFKRHSTMNDMHGIFE